MFKVGQKVKIKETEIVGLVVGRSPKHWWPNLDDCFQVSVRHHGTFNVPESKLNAA